MAELRRQKLEGRTTKGAGTKEASVALAAAAAAAEKAAERPPRPKKKGCFGMVLLAGALGAALSAAAHYFV